MCHFITHVKVASHLLDTSCQHHILNTHFHEFHTTHFSFLVLNILSVVWGGEEKLIHYFIATNFMMYSADPRCVYHAEISHYNT